MVRSWLLVIGGLVLWPQAGRGEVDVKGFDDVVKPFLGQHCTKCHGEKKQKAKLTLHDLEADFTSAEARTKWEGVFDMLSLGEMPPRDEKQPAARRAVQIANWVRTELAKSGHRAQDKRLHPAFGNYVDHDELFSAKPRSVPQPPPRLWRLRPATYDRNLQGVAKGSYTTPFTLNTSSGGFQDYAHLYKLDSGSLGLLLGNARAVARRMTSFKIEKGKIARDGWSTPDQFLRILDPDNETPSDEELLAAIEWQYHRVLQRDPRATERDRLLAFFRSGIEKSGKLLALRNVVQAVLLTPEALYRTELGTGEPDAHGRVRLAPREIAYAISYALTDTRPDGALLKAAETGALDTAAGVAEEVKRILESPRIEKPRLLGFWREYFGYTGAYDVFKDEKLFPQHRPNVLVSDTDRLVLHILENDRDVFRELLTTQKSFVNYAHDRKPGPRRAERNKLVHLSYNLPPDWKFAREQPIELPGDQRAGILTQPSWLVAKSDNFDNHAILRGKWVRERLLGGTIPDLPITVDAQLPNEPHATLRHRMRVTRESECWRCHVRMNPLGETFEMFDHFGRWRPYERVLDREATKANVDRKGEPRGEVYGRAPVDSSGLVEESGDPRLEGEVAGAVEMIHKLAGSERVRQVWLRHVFRYFMGRNETLDDAATLQAAEEVYLESDGSFRALVISLLTSESFLMRRMKNN